MDPIETLLTHIENSEKLYQILRDNLYPNLNNKLKTSNDKNVLFQMINNFVVKAARDYTTTHQTAENWNKLFNKDTRYILTSLLVSQYEGHTGLFHKTRIKSKQQSHPPFKYTTQPPPVNTPPKRKAPTLSAQDMKIITAAAQLKHMHSKKHGLRIIENFLNTELQAFCEYLQLPKNGNKSVLQLRIISYYLGTDKKI